MRPLPALAIALGVSSGCTAIKATYHVSTADTAVAEAVKFGAPERATYEYTMRLNVAAPYFLTQRFAQHWVANQIRGRVLMIGSINGRLAEPTHTCYDSSKGAIEMAADRDAQPRTVRRPRCLWYQRIGRW